MTGTKNVQILEENGLVPPLLLMAHDKNKMSEMVGCSISSFVLLRKVDIENPLFGQF